jgi:hypothetical protein
MSLQVALLPSAIPDLFAEVSKSGKITLADRYGLMAALLDESISDEEKGAIDRILYSVRKGRLQMVDDLSAVL